MRGVKDKSLVLINKEKKKIAKRQLKFHTIHLQYKLCQEGRDLLEIDAKMSFLHSYPVLRSSYVTHSKRRLAEVIINSMKYSCSMLSSCQETHFVKEQTTGPSLCCSSIKPYTVLLAI
jgi:hypothetical protein